MNRLIKVLLLVAITCQSVTSHRCEYSQTCDSYKYTLEDIGKLLEEESNYHRLNLRGEGGNSYYSQTLYILRALNDKITNSYRQSSYGSSNNGNECRQLEEAIMAKTKEFGIEKIGLESSLIRLRKVLNYQDERNRFNVDMLEESNNKTQNCIQSAQQLENENKMLNSNLIGQSKQIIQQDEKNKSLEKENRRLQAKLNANAPAIHGTTGKIYPAVNDSSAVVEVAGPATTSTTETTTTTGIDTMKPIPDIDLRNGE